MKLSPCKDCSSRRVGCHSTCDEYIKWCSYTKTIKEKRIAENNLGLDYIRRKTNWEKYKRRAKKARPALRH